MSMFNWQYQNIFLFSILDEAGNNIPISQWNGIQDEYLSQLSILNELADNGFAEIKSHTYEVETIEILNLSEIEKQILCLPNQYPYEIYIQSDGQLNQSSFRFKYGFYDFTPNGNRFNVHRKGAILEIEECKYLLSVNQFLICEAIEEFNCLSESERTFSHNLKCFAEIKSFSRAAASILDSYLQNENVYCPDKIKIDLAFEDETLEIIPIIDIENKDGFVKAFDISPRIKEVYPVTDSEGNRTRIVIDEKQRKELEKVKAKRKITDRNEINKIVDHPENFFDDETIDISVFYSERVKEIGIYKPMFYPFICPYKSEWIPGIAIKDRVDGEKRIYFKTPIELKEFEIEKQTAQKIGKNSFEWKGAEISIDDAERFIHIAKKQFENPKEPVCKREPLNEDEVLIIKENVESLEYVEGQEKTSTINYSFSQIRNLKQFVELKTHQVEGIAWLQTLQKKGSCGCLLADDMGLGKTLQVLYFIEWHAQVSQDSKPYLIVAPVTLLENWENEYQSFFSPQTIPLTLLYGTIDLSKEFSKEKVDQLQRKHIILTNYETLRTYQLSLCAIDYAIVVLDEAQKIKTPGTLVTNVTKALKADFKIAMTGTPVENTLVDLWCIMDFSFPGLLGNAKDFAREFQNCLKEKTTNVTELGKKIRDKIGIYIKRRLKEDVAEDLPKKFDNENSKIKRQMPKEQLERYKIEIEQAKSIDLNGTDRRNQILRSLWTIRDISDHPFLADSQISNFKPDELVRSSAKLQISIDLLTEIKAKDEKAIIFADRKETQKMLQKVIFDYFEIFPRIINGDTPTIKKAEDKTIVSRQQTINRFESEKGFNVIIMSQLAAGVGLNVTAANHVIHYSRHWNPAKEQQATAILLT